MSHLIIAFDRFDTKSAL